jgi:predicted PurR-regulated permease PerM
MSPRRPHAGLGSFQDRYQESALAARKSAVRMDHPVIVTFLVIAVVTSMALAAEVLKPLSLAALLSFALVPVARFWERLGLPRGPAAVLTVGLALTGLGGLGYYFTRELASLAALGPRYEQQIIKKIERLRPARGTAAGKLQRVLDDVTRELDQPLVPEPEPERAAPVRVISAPTFRDRLTASIGPLLEPLATSVVVVILVFFLLLRREEMSDRLVRLCGHNRMSLTTKTLDEVGRRISRYLATFAVVNSTCGLVVGLGLAGLGVRYAVLWGSLAAILRFIPYVGPATAFALPFAFSVASTDGWRQPLEVAALFGVIELLANSYLEPVIYGKTTGVSSVGLLIAAMFWTWLWGPLGLVLSTPLTVCLAVLGKYVASLSFFGTLLADEPALEPAVKFYQRLVTLDQDGANEVLEAIVKERPRVDVFDRVLIPALSRAEIDHARQEIDDTDREFIWRVIGEALTEIEATAQPALEQATGARPAPPLPNARVLGVASNDEADALVLRMLELELRDAGVELDLIVGVNTPLKLSEQIARDGPQLVVLSHVPPNGLTSTRYLVRRLRAHLGDLPIVVGRWREGCDPSGVAEKLAAVGASRVVFTVAEARDHILRGIRPAQPVNGPIPALAGR